MYNLKLNLRKILHSQKSFTLIEVLIAIGIIVLTAALAIPNLRNFQEDAALSQAADEIIAGIRKVQANAHSGVKCSTGNISSSWSISFTPADTKFQIVCNFESDDVETSLTEESSVLNDVLLSLSCDGEAPEDTKITFTSISLGETDVSVPCPNSLSFKISLKSNKSGEEKNISVDSNGVISEN